jgi:hypothetical protein
MLKSVSTFLRESDWAVVASLIETCKLTGADRRTYLADSSPGSYPSAEASPDGHPGSSTAILRAVSMNSCPRPN